MIFDDKQQFQAALVARVERMAPPSETPRTEDLYVSRYISTSADLVSGLVGASEQAERLLLVACIGAEADPAARRASVQCLIAHALDRELQLGIDVVVKEFKRDDKSGQLLCDCMVGRNDLVVLIGELQDDGPDMARALMALGLGPNDPRFLGALSPHCSYVGRKKGARIYKSQRLELEQAVCALDGSSLEARLAALSLQSLADLQRDFQTRCLVHSLSEIAVMGCRFPLLRGFFEAAMGEPRLQEPLKRLGGAQEEGGGSGEGMGVDAGGGLPSSYDIPTSYGPLASYLQQQQQTERANMELWKDGPIMYGFWIAVEGVAAGLLQLVEFFTTAKASKRTTKHSGSPFALKVALLRRLVVTSLRVFEQAAGKGGLTSRGMGLAAGWKKEKKDVRGLLHTAETCSAEDLVKLAELLYPWVAGQQEEQGLGAGAGAEAARILRSYRKAFPRVGIAKEKRAVDRFAENVNGSGPGLTDAFTQASLAAQQKHKHDVSVGMVVLFSSHDWDRSEDPLIVQLKQKMENYLQRSIFMSFETLGTLALRLLRQFTEDCTADRSGGNADGASRGWGRYAEKWRPRGGKSVGGAFWTTGWFVCESACRSFIGLF